MGMGMIVVKMMEKDEEKHKKETKRFAFHRAIYRRHQMCRV